MCPVPSAGRRRQSHPADSAPARSAGEQYACAERRAELTFSSARSFLGTPRIRRSRASGKGRLSRQQALVAPSAIFFMYLGLHIGAQSLCACPPLAIKGEACDVTHTRNLRLASSYKLSSNTFQSRVGYYAPAARTTLNPCVFLCTTPLSHPGFKEQSWVHLIHAPQKTTYIITECIEINVTLIIVFII
jgi:hypothetical protein